MTDTGSGKIGKNVLEGDQVGCSGAGVREEGTCELRPEGDGGSVWSPGRPARAGVTGRPELGRRLCTLDSAGGGPSPGAEFGLQFFCGGVGTC